MRYILQRYMAAQFIKPFVIGTAFFVIFLLTFQLFKVTEVIVSSGMNGLFVLELIWEIALSLFPLAMPLAIFFSTLYSLGKSSEESELVVMRSVGMSKFQILQPYLLVSVLAALVLFFISDVLSPRAKISFKEKVSLLKTQGTLTNIKSGEFFTLIPKVTLFAKEVDSKNNKLNDIFIHFEEKKQKKTIMAKRGKLIKKITSSGKLEMDLILNDGNIFQQDKVESDKILFSQYTFPIPLGSSKTYNPKPQNMEGADLENFLDMGIANFNKTKGSVKTFYRVQLEYHNRRNMPLALIVFTLIAFSLGFQSQRRKNRGGLKAFVFLLAFYIVYFSAISLGTKGILPIPFLIYSPTFLLFLVFIYFYRKMDWAS